VPVDIVSFVLTEEKCSYRKVPLSSRNLSILLSTIAEIE
jgi:hypothetical protein